MLCTCRHEFNHINLSHNSASTMLSCLDVMLDTVRGFVECHSWSAWSGVGLEPSLRPCQLLFKSELIDIIEWDRLNVERNPASKIRDFSSAVCRQKNSSLWVRWALRSNINFLCESRILKQQSNFKCSLQCGEGRRADRAHLISSSLSSPLSSSSL